MSEAQGYVFFLHPSWKSELGHIEGVRFIESPPATIKPGVKVKTVPHWVELKAKAAKKLRRMGK